MSGRKKTWLEILFAPSKPKRSFGQSLARLSHPGKKYRTGNTPFYEKSWNGSPRKRRI